MATSIPMSEIAKMAGVSLSTVSRFVNGKAVAPETARALESCIRQIGYVAPPVERRTGPKARISVQNPAFRDICLLSIGMAGNLAKTQIIHELVAGIHIAASRHGARIFLAEFDTNKGKALEKFVSECDGFLVIDDSPEPQQDLINNLMHVSTVFLYTRHCYDSRSNFDQVFYDNRMVGELAAKYLLKNSCQSFLVVNHYPESNRFNERCSDFIITLKREGISENQIEIIDSKADTDTNILIEKRLKDNLPDGIFITADDALLLTWLAHKDRSPSGSNGLPEFPIFIGCTNEHSVMQQLRQKPASIDLKLSLLGERAFEMLYWRISHKKLVTPTLRAPYNMITTPELATVNDFQ